MIKRLNLNPIKLENHVFIYTLTRRTKVAFLSTVGYFGSDLSMLLPKKHVNLEQTLQYFNNDEFKSTFMFSGRFKIGHCHISNSISHEFKWLNFYCGIFI